MPQVSNMSWYSTSMKSLLIFFIWTISMNLAKEKNMKINKNLKKVFYNMMI